MGFDIEGITLTSPSANALVITNNSNTMTFNSSGRLLVPGTPVFTASGTSAAYEYRVPLGWYTITFSSVLNNVGSCFNGTTGRFTAPITGRYLFTFSSYSNLNAASIAEYMHPLFLVNGSYTSRRGGGSSAYRLRGHGYADYYKDMEMTEIFALQASDYVEVYIYHSTTTCGVYGTYKLYTGVFLG
jgi:hypothetical protein